MMDFFSQNNGNTAPQRTPLLWILALCTIISAALNFIDYSLFMLFPDYMQNMVEASMKLPFFKDEMYKKVFDMYLSISKGQYLFLALTEVAMFVGALLMLWKLNPLGFHFYTCGQLGSFFVRNILIGGLMTMDMMTILCVVMLVLLYAMQMRVFRPAAQPPKDNSDSEKPDEDVEH